MTGGRPILSMARFLHLQCLRSMFTDRPVLRIFLGSPGIGAGTDASGDGDGLTCEREAHGPRLKFAKLVDIICSTFPGLHIIYALAYTFCSCSCSRLDF
jgi:hypothetical protein